jgi:hypothetical protein
MVEPADDDDEQNQAEEKPQPRVTPSCCRGNRDSAARFLLERHGHAIDTDLQRLRDVVSDLHRQRLAERAFVPEPREIELE